MNTIAITPAPPRTTRVLGWVICAFAVIGLALSVASLIAHYKTSPTDYCDVGATFNCDIVNRSIYSAIGPVPVAGIGVAGYILLIALSFVRKRPAALVMFAGALAGLGFALYLTYIEAYILFTWCILCLGSLSMISIIVLLSGWRMVQALRHG